MNDDYYIENQRFLTTSDKTIAVLCHLAPILGYALFIGHIAIPLIIMLWKGRESKFLSLNAREALNFQLSLTIYWIVNGILMLFLVGFIFAAFLIVFQLIVMINAAIKAGSGSVYRYPLCIRFIK
ncbi:orotate phosphoribosyltransferase [Candidatus Magnetoovum chiemensis]|nr:orotate phosphoribosyltransferase [Candidatus Magnetoovum chiemensis]